MVLNQLRGMLTGNMGRLPCPENAAIVRRVAAEGMVLLKNNGILPLKGKRAALFGAGAENPVYCGTGSGYVFTEKVVTVTQGLKNAGITVTTEGYLKRCAAHEKAVNKADKTLGMMDRRWSGLFIPAIAPLPSREELTAALEDCDTAIYVLRRTAGEGGDRRTEKGDYYLDDYERADLELLSRNFAHIVVVLNTCVLDLNFADQIPHIDALVYMGLAGMETGNALADLLTGRVNFSGRLTDTLARRYADYPAAGSFGTDGCPEHPVYREGIFVGYRHFDTFGIEPLYPFGYGLSYTDFDISVAEAAADWESIRLTVRVKNTGSVPGREVVQVYASAPGGRLPKPYQELKGFRKTDLIAPGEEQSFPIVIPTESLASFDEASSAWVMEPGDYLLRVGRHSRDTAVAATVTLDAEAVVRRVTDILHCDAELPAAEAPRFDHKPAGIALVLKAEQCVTAENVSAIPKTVQTYIPEGTAYASVINENPYKMPWFRREETVTVAHRPQSTFLDVMAGAVSMEEFVASLSPEILARIVTGILEETPFPAADRTGRKLKKLALPQSSGATTGQYMGSLGIPQALLFDGPAGVHIPGCAATAFPVGMVAAQTWDEKLGEEMGRAYARDMAHFHVSVTLGPGMNIHRDPLCGRSFEYYSEDPLLTGKTAAAFTRGVQSLPGRGVAIKHFAANSQETCRLDGNSSVSTRALREIYLKGFEIAVREAAPMTVMSSYNKLNGTHTGSHYELLTDLLRGEWGFEGMVMSDWGTHSDKARDLHAGNDIIMGGYSAETLLGCMRRQAPEFAPDGNVVETVKSMHFGIVKLTQTRWGSFVPDAAGEDTVTTAVAAGTEVSRKVLEHPAASVTENPDGSKTVTWRGTDRGAYLSLGELQQCAIRVLRMAGASAGMEDLRGSLK